LPFKTQLATATSCCATRKQCQFRRKLDATLHKVQSAANFPTKVTQAGQVSPKTLSHPALATQSQFNLSPALKLLQKFPSSAASPPLVGLGVRPEHVTLRSHHNPSRVSRAGLISGPRPGSIPKTQRSLNQNYPQKKIIPPKGNPLSPIGPKQFWILIFPKSGRQSRPQSSRISITAKISHINHDAEIKQAVVLLAPSYQSIFADRGPLAARRLVSLRW